MTASDIGKILFAVAATELLTCVVARQVIFKSESYTRTVGTFERAKARRDKTVASMAAKRAAREEQAAKNPPGKKQQSSQKSTEKDAKKLQRENEELSALAAEVARRHTMGAFYSSIAFLILYRILAAEYSGKLVALLPFEPFNLLQRVTSRGLSETSLKDLASLWVQSQAGAEATVAGETALLHPDVTSVSQACSFAFLYVLCSLSVKMMVNMVFGIKPPEGAADGVGTLIEAPQSKKMMKNFGLDAEDVKEARKAVGL